MSEQPDLSTLPKRMRYAADVIAEAINRAVGDDTNQPPLQVAYTPNNLRKLAGDWEAEDREEARRGALVEELSRELLMAFTSPPNTPDEIARKSTWVAAELLVQHGWRKAPSR